MSSFNSKLAGDVLRSIFTNESEHNQARWLEVPYGPGGDYTIDVGSMESGHLCGTSACIAGWAALHAGYKVEVKTYTLAASGRSLDLISPEGEIIEERRCEIEFKEEGRQALGLAGTEAAALFYTLDEKLAVARLYSKIKTGELNGLLDEAEEELSAKGYFSIEDGGHRYSTTVINEIYRRAQEEYSPALDVLKTLTEPVLESAEK